ncbi:hypothetical protein [Nonomuraea longicatena]|uniref:Uncharacterized protein n=1 Tax=Nonomuraea longicatena TaxID=83682 RepID=A0ABN1PB51_9ACTN
MKPRTLLCECTGVIEAPPERVAAPSGSRLTHSVYNVAQRMRWAVPLANRFFVGFGDRTRDGFAEGLRDLAAELGCAARPE